MQVLAWSPYALETYSNAEAIAINQDPLGSPAFRIVGGDLQSPCSGSGATASVVSAACDASDPLQAWAYDATSGRIALASNASWVLDAVECGTADGTAVAVYPPDNGQGTCGGKNQQWAFNANGSVTNDFSGSCLDVYDFTGPGAPLSVARHAPRAPPATVHPSIPPAVVDTWTCNGGVNQNFTLSAGGLLATVASAQHPSTCLAASPAGAQSCTNVWGRVLSDGYALGFVNNGGDAVDVSCGPACFAALNITATSLKVRDVWAHADIGVITAPFSFSASVNGSGFAALFKLTPA